MQTELKYIDLEEQYLLSFLENSREKEFFDYIFFPEFDEKLNIWQETFEEFLFFSYSNGDFK